MLGTPVNRMPRWPQQSAKFNGRLRLDGVHNVAAMALVRFMVRGKHAARAPELFKGLRDGADLSRAVRGALDLSIEDFETEWKAFCKEPYPPQEEY